MAAAPARLAGLEGRKGTLAPGADADIVVFDPDAEWTAAKRHLHFRHKLSPYLGVRLRGQVQETWLRGAPVYTRCSPVVSEECFAGDPRGRELIRE
jgi:allantoinase